MNLARARRRWLAWDRYASRCERLGPHVFAGPGVVRAAAEEAFLHYLGVGRRFRLNDEAQLAGRVMADLFGDGDQR